LKNFTFENVKVTANDGELKKQLFDGLILKNVEVNGMLID
jgi:hypothetical protein